MLDVNGRSYLGAVAAGVWPRDPSHLYNPHICAPYVNSTTGNPTKTSEPPTGNSTSSQLPAGNSTHAQLPAGSSTDAQLPADNLTTTHLPQSNLTNPGLPASNLTKTDSTKGQLLDTHHNETAAH